MDLHKTLQSFANFENIQVPIAPIVKDKLLVLHIWHRYVLLKYMNLKNKKFIYDYKNQKLTFSMTIWWSESILH